VQVFPVEIEAVSAEWRLLLIICVAASDDDYQISTNQSFVFFFLSALVMHQRVGCGPIRKQTEEYSRKRISGPSLRKTETIRKIRTSISFALYFISDNELFLSSGWYIIFTPLSSVRIERSTIESIMGDRWKSIGIQGKIPPEVDRRDILDGVASSLSPNVGIWATRTCLPSYVRMYA
jgi:hypothetical protein